MAACRFPAAIAQIAIVLAAARSASAIALIRELVRILGSHVAHNDNDNNEDYHDYDCQDENELNHRTIQLAWPHRVAQARRTQPSTRAFPLFASTQGSARSTRMYS
jgi:hypothetical protein